MPSTPNPIPADKPIPGSKPSPATEPEIPNVDISENSSVEAERKMEHDADEAAHRAAKTEQKYDSQHTIISK